MPHMDTCPGGVREHARRRACGALGLCVSQRSAVTVGSARSAQALALSPPPRLRLRLFPCQTAIGQRMARARISPLPLSSLPLHSDLPLSQRRRPRARAVAFIVALWYISSASC